MKTEENMMDSTTICSMIMFTPAFLWWVRIQTNMYFLSLSPSSCSSFSGAINPLPRGALCRSPSFLYLQGSGYENWRKDGYCEFRIIHLSASFPVHLPHLSVSKGEHPWARLIIFIIIDAVRALVIYILDYFYGFLVSQIYIEYYKKKQR